MTEKGFPMNGVWVSTMPEDTDDYLVEYTISSDGQQVHISAKDLQDGEEFEISDVQWDGAVLSFKSYVPSTMRCGVAHFCLKANGKIESKFTFTVLEELKKIG